MRQAHSIKGMAATMGYVQMVGVAHAMEDMFEVDQGEADDLVNQVRSA